MKIASYPVNRAIHSGEQIAVMDFRPLAARRGDTVELVLHVRKTASSLNLRVALAGASAPKIAAGNLFTFGEGVMGGAPAPERFFSVPLSLDVTAAAQSLAGQSQVAVHLEILDGRGRTERKETVFVESIELHAEETGR